MMFKGRTVLAFVLLAVFAGSILTLAITGPLDAGAIPALAQHESVFRTKGKDNPGKDGLSDEEITKLSAVYKLLEQRYVDHVDREKLAEGMLDGLVDALKDPYSEYLNKAEVESFSGHIHSTFTGIGAEVALKEGNVVVVAPIKNSPAERAGILPGDTILAVNGEPLQGLELTKAVEKIRGPKGTQAKLRIIRDGSSKPMDIIVVRDDISLETVEARMVDDKIGLIEIRQFAVNTGERFAEELKRLEGEGMKALMIDVRNNPGGVVQAVQSIAETFVPKGKTIMHLEYRDGKREKTVSKGSGKPYPIAVLINEGSASASEILAAAIQESSGGTLVGKTTFGKGLVQSTVQLNDGTGVKLTIAKWLTPDGGTIHETGVSPDIEVDQPILFEALAIPKDEVLEYDQVNDAVKNVQLILQGLGYRPGRTDGYFSETTKSAVIQFQREHGLTASGEVDDATALKLEETVIAEYLNPENDAQFKAAKEYIHNLLTGKAGE